MNKTIMLSTAIVASIVAAMVLAAPQSVAFGKSAADAPNRADAYHLAIAD